MTALLTQLYWTLQMSGNYFEVLRSPHKDLALKIFFFSDFFTQAVDSEWSRLDFHTKFVNILASGNLAYKNTFIHPKNSSSSYKLEYIMNVRKNFLKWKQKQHSHEGKIEEKKNWNYTEFECKEKNWNYVSIFSLWSLFLMYAS